jgi:hypothetical protein
MQASREDINSKYLLYPTEFNYLSHQIALRYKADSLSDSANAFHLIRRGAKKYVICPVSKDAQTASNESSLKFIRDVIEEFLALLPKQDDHDYHLLLPMRLCRGFLKIRPSIPYAQREHLVLVELDLKKMSFQIHDSQGVMLKRLYPDKLSEIKSIAGINVSYDHALNYHAYGIQDDHFSCGYYVLAYIESIIKTGMSGSCKSIKLNIQKDYADKKDYCNQHGVPEFIAFINGQPVASETTITAVDDFDVYPEDNEDEKERAREEQKQNDVSRESRRKFSPLLSSGMFVNSEYIVVLDPVIVPPRKTS